MTLRPSIAGLIGLAFALVWPFLDWSRIPGWLPLPGIMLPCAVASALGVIAFGINKRRFEFFGLRPIGRRDMGAAVLAFFGVLAVLALAEPVVAHFGGSAPPHATGDSLREDPLWLALLTAAGAGVFEEFIYRGFVIEELGERIGSRRIAASVALLFFALAHHVNRGWSLELIYPGLTGAVFTVLYLRRRNLPLCMLLHATLDASHALTR